MMSVRQSKRGAPRSRSTPVAKAAPLGTVSPPTSTTISPTTDNSDARHGSGRRAEESEKGEVPIISTTNSSRSPVTRGKSSEEVKKEEFLESEATATDFTITPDEFLEGGMELSVAEEDDDTVDDLLEFQTKCLREITEEEFQASWSRTQGQRALFLDYDGTLREFEASPELAQPTEELLALLTELNDREDFAPCIISGRDSTFLEEHFGRFDRFTLVAEHGFQISLPSTNRTWCLWEQYGGDVRNYRDHENWKQKMAPAVEELVRQYPGSMLEEKQSSLVWHYRQVEQTPEAEVCVFTAVHKLEEVARKENVLDVKIRHGHMVVEVAYRNVRKGLVLRKLCEHQALYKEPYAAVLAAGDDNSDETMFQAASNDFLTIKVGQGASLARFRTDSPAEFRRFLRERILSK